MTFMSVWSVYPTTRKEAVARFLQQRGATPDGVKVLGRWHKADGSGGFTLFEADTAKAGFEYAAAWADLVEIHSTAVIEDAEAVTVLAKAAGA